MVPNIYIIVNTFPIFFFLYNPINILTIPGTNVIVSNAIVSVCPIPGSNISFFWAYIFPAKYPKKLPNIRHPLYKINIPNITAIFFIPLNLVVNENK